MARIPVSIPGIGAPFSVSPPAEPKQVTTSRAANDLQTFDRVASRPSMSLPFGNGNLLTGVSFTATVAQSLNHGLGRPYAGALALNFVGAAGTMFSTVPANLALMAAQITLTCSATCVCDVWVY